MATKTKNVSFCDLVNFQERNIQNPEELWPEKKREYKDKKDKKLEGERPIIKSNLMESAL